MNCVYKIVLPVSAVQQIRIFCVILTERHYDFEPLNEGQLHSYVKYCCYRVLYISA